jgi:hypothetical protein
MYGVNICSCGNKIFLGLANLCVHHCDSFFKRNIWAFFTYVFVHQSGGVGMETCYGLGRFWVQNQVGGMERFFPHPSRLALGLSILLVRG